MVAHLLGKFQHFFQTGIISRFGDLVLFFEKLLESPLVLQHNAKCECEHRPR
jgi:hypothetical protein